MVLEEFLKHYGTAQKAMEIALKPEHLLSRHPKDALLMDWRDSGIDIVEGRGLPGLIAFGTYTLLHPLKYATVVAYDFRRSINASSEN